MIKLKPNAKPCDDRVQVGAKGRILLRTEFENYFGLVARYSRVDYYLLDNGDVEVRFNPKGDYLVSSNGERRGNGELCCLIQVPRVLPQGRWAYTLEPEKMVIHCGGAE